MNKLAAGFARIVENLIGYFVVLAVCLVTYGVIARMLNISVAWTDELLRTIFLWLIFIAAAMAYKTDNLIGFDLLNDMMTKRPRLLLCLKFLQGIGALIFGVFMSVHMFTIVSTQFSTSELTPVLNLPLWFVNSGCLLGSVLTVAFVFQKFFQLLTGKNRHE
ncbi:MAG: TRAP transporter small permease subunit [Candidatus Accumulibacter sp.]|jgi:TRAP-type C4-dicarboxylate transport system permease small subunit|nr:TRAP transporter small permease subunit [Accumulibacter sp.]